MKVHGMEALEGKLEQIVAEFAAWVRGLAAGVTQVQDVSAVERLERQVREGGQQRTRLTSRARMGPAPGGRPGDRGRVRGGVTVFMPFPSL